MLATLEWLLVKKNGLLGLALAVSMLGSLRQASAQGTPLDEAVRVADGREPSAELPGDWLNVDPQTRGIVRITIKGQKIHPYGSCHPTACDWGVTEAQVFASAVDKRDVVALLASPKTKFSTSVLTITIEPDGRLRVQRFVHYTDRSGRFDMSAVDYFTRRGAGAPPTAPAIP